ncbi:ABC transporter permease [Arenimonas fontis]|uniref:Iron ABC transporter permease n=1 Tax=Arenimonas fontis TaxID=2608255 RepID=A0A5B2ZBC1_9GAMM|nr:iron ABC transporter permease [Arenimonas fontis]KAA2285255.1 iron ABC transporter permease [Arenimonas fontis]
MKPGPLRRIGFRLCAWVLALPVLAPVLWLASAGGTPAPEVWPHLWREVLPQAAVNTLGLLALIAGIALPVGVGLAWASARYEWPGRRFFDWALVLPLALPGYVVAFVYVGLADYAGPLQGAWRALGLPAGAFPELRSVPGAALVLALVLYPYLFLITRAAFLRQGSAAMDAARMLGHSPRSAFLRAALPLARPAWVAGLSLVLLEALADFGAVSILGVDTLATSVYKAWFGLYSLPAAAQLALGLVGVVALVLVLERLGRGRARHADRQPLPPPRRRLRGWHGWVVASFAGAVLLLGFVLPMAQLAWWSWQMRADLPAVGEAARNTAGLAMMATLLVLALSLLFVVLGRRSGGDRWVRAAGFSAGLGYAMPGTVLAVGAMWWLVAVERGHPWLATLALSSSLAGILLALSARFLRVGHEATEAAFDLLRPSLLESARLLGAPPRRRLLRVALPLLRPGLIAAALLVLVEVVKELPATLMLRPFGWDTLAVKVYAYTSEGLWQQAAWPGLWLCLVGLLPVWWLVRQQG